MFSNFIKAASKYSKDATRDYAGCIKFTQKDNDDQEMVYTNGYFCWSLIIKGAGHCVPRTFSTIIPLMGVGYTTCTDVAQYPQWEKAVSAVNFPADEEKAVACLHRGLAILKLMATVKTTDKTHILCADVPVVAHEIKDGHIRADWLASFLGIMDKKRDHVYHLPVAMKDGCEIFQVKNRKFELTGWFCPVSTGGK